jgi:hypothetical protein
VPDLGVAHLPDRQADGKTRRLERRVRARREERIEIGRIGRFDGVARNVGGFPEAVIMTSSAGRFFATYAKSFAVLTIA